MFEDDDFNFDKEGIEDAVDKILSQNPTKKPKVSDLTSNKSTFSTSHSNATPNTRKRKFPGPAGLLPDRNSSNSSNVSIKNSNTSLDNSVMCSQVSSETCNNIAWLKMCEDFRPLKPNEQFLPDKYTVRWIKEKAVTNKLINQKGPFLAAVIQTINSYNMRNSIVVITLRDKTGSIEGTILNNLYEEYSDDISIDSVLVLKQFGVLNTGVHEEPFLTITPNNLICIYTNVNANKSEDNSSQISDITDKCRKITIQNITAEEINENIENIRIEFENKKIKNFDQNAPIYNFKQNFQENNIRTCSDFQKITRNNSNSTDIKQNTTVSSNIIIKPESNIKKSFTFKISDSSNNANKQQNDILNLNDVDYDDIFNSDLSCFSSTQQTSDTNKSVSEKKKNSKIVENVLGDIDTSTLFDDF